MDERGRGAAEVAYNNFPPHWRNFKEFNTLGENDVIVTIQYCSNCEEHAKSTRHIPEKYQLFARKLKQAILAAYPSVRVFLKPISSEEDQKVSYIPLKAAVLPGAKGASTTGIVSSCIDDYRPETRIGAFEMQAASRFAGGQVLRKIIFSKFESKCWPAIWKVVEDLEQVLPKCTVVVQLFQIEENNEQETTQTVAGLMRNKNPYDSNSTDAKFVRKSGYIASVKKNRPPRLEEGSDEESKGSHNSERTGVPPPPPKPDDPEARKFADLEVELAVDIGTTKSICEDLGKQLARKGLTESRSHNANLRPAISAAYAMMKGNIAQTIDTSNNKSALFSARPNSSYSQRNGRPSSAHMSAKMGDKSISYQRGKSHFFNQNPGYTSLAVSSINYDSKRSGANNISTTSYGPGLFTGRSKTPAPMRASPMKVKPSQSFTDSSAGFYPQFRKKSYIVRTNENGQAIFENVPVTKLIISLPESKKFRASQKTFSAVQQSARSKRPFFNIYLGVRPQLISHSFVEVYDLETKKDVETHLLVTAHLLYAQHREQLQNVIDPNDPLNCNFSYDFKMDPAHKSHFSGRVPPGIYMFQVTLPTVINKYEEFTEVVSLRAGEQRFRFHLAPFKKIPYATFAAINCETGGAIRRTSMLLTPCELQAQTPAIDGTSHAQFVHQGLSDPNTGLFTFNLNESSVFKVRAEKEGFLPMQKDFFLTKGNRDALKDVVVPMLPTKLLSNLQGGALPSKVVLVLHSDLHPQIFKLRIIPVDKELSSFVVNSLSPQKNEIIKKKKHKKRKSKKDKDHKDDESLSSPQNRPISALSNDSQMDGPKDYYIDQNCRSIFGSWGYIVTSSKPRWYRIVAEIEDLDAALDLTKIDPKRWDKHLSNGVQDTNLTFSMISTKGRQLNNVYPCPFLPPTFNGRPPRFWDIGFINANNADFIEMNAFRAHLPSMPDQNLHCLLMFLRYLHKRSRFNFKKVFGFDLHGRYKFQDCFITEREFIEAFKNIGIKFRKETSWSRDQSNRRVDAFLRNFANSFKNALGEVSLSKIQKSLSLYLANDSSAQSPVSEEDEESEAPIPSFKGSPAVKTKVHNSNTFLSPQFSSVRGVPGVETVLSKQPTFGTSSSPSPPQRKY